MRDFGLKLCLFLFLAAVLAGCTNELGTLTGAITGTILLWPAYAQAAASSASKGGAEGCGGRGSKSAA